MKNNYNLKICNHELDCSFIQLMPDYLKKEVFDVVEKYENNHDAAFNIDCFIKVWDEYCLYIWNSSRSKWAHPLKYFSDNERKFIFKDTTEKAKNNFVIKKNENDILKRGNKKNYTEQPNGPCEALTEFKGTDI